MLWIAVGAFVVLLLTGMPVVFAIGLASVIAIYFGSDLPILIVAQRMVGQIDSFTLLAVPFFMLVGEVMERGGIAQRLVRLAACLVAHLRGGLAQVNVMASILFSGISGSTAADASAIGSLLIPSMVKRGYSRPFSAAITAASATIGPIIPPSSIAIIYAAIANVSVGQLFLAGIIPGLLIGAGLMVAVHIYAVRLGYPVEGRATLRETLVAVREAAWALFVPFIIVGGILSGAFTATESGAIAAVYSLVVAIFVYGELSIRDLPRVFLRASLTTGLVMIVIASAGVFAWILANEGLPLILRDLLLTISSNRYVVLFIILALMLAIGCVMEIVAAGIIMIPVLYPIARFFGFDDIHFALLIMMTMAIGAVTPPVGVTLYITLGIADTSLTSTSRYLWPMVGVLVLVLALVAVVPPLATAIPRAFFG